VTTSSLEALQAYGLGNKALDEQGDLAATSYFKRAVELDPKFAYAYMRLGALYGNLGDGKLEEENVKKAYALRDHISERERYRLMFNYFGLITDEPDKAKPLLELWARTYPRDATPYVEMGALAQWTGQVTDAVKAGEKAIQLDPGNSVAYENLAAIHVAVDRLDDAQAVVDRAKSRKFDPEYIHYAQYQIMFLRGDVEGMQRELTWANEHPGSGLVFAKILRHRGLIASQPNAALAHLGLARAYALQGEGSKAKSAYQDFLTLWKDADPDIPILKQAKAEYAKMQ